MYYLEADFPSYQDFINEKFDSEYNSIFCFFMKNYFFNDNYSFKTVLARFTEIHSYSIGNIKSKEIYLDNFDFYAQAILKSNEDYDIVKKFIKQQQITKSFDAF